MRRTTTVASNDLFSVVRITDGRKTNFSIEARHVATGLGPWITNSGSGSGGVSSTNANQFGESTILTLKSGGLQTNGFFYAATSGSHPLSLNAASGQSVDLFRINDSTGVRRFGVNYEGVLYGDAGGAPRLASTSTAGDVWTASDTTGIGSFTAPAQQTNTSVVRQTQLTTASNALVTILTSYDTTTSNGLYSLILGGGITANTATNIAQYFATNSAIITSNQLVSTLAPKASPTFTGAVTISSGTANEIVAFDASKVLVPVTGVSATEAGYLDGVTSLIQSQLDTKPSTTVLNTSSNAIVSMLVANDTTTSNALHSAYIVADSILSSAFLFADTTTSNGIIGLFPTLGTNNPVTLSAGTLTLISSQTARYYTNSAGSFPFTFSGTPNASSRVSLAVSNTSASTIYVTNSSGIYDPRDAAFVTTLAIPAQSQSTFHFRRNATSGWELEGVIEKPLGLAAGINTTLSTNSGNVSVVGALSFSTNGSSWISATQLVARSGIVISNDAAGTVSFHVAASGGGSTTNVPPVVLAINGGTGTTNVVIDMWQLAQMSTNSVQITLTANAGIIVTNVIAGKELALDIIQDSTGNRTIAASSVGGAPLRFGSDITGFGLSTNGTYKDHVKLRGVGTNAHVVGMIRGYAP